MLGGRDRLEVHLSVAGIRRERRDAIDRQKIASQRQQSASHVATVSADENI
jgi:hypothetical protein